MIGLLQILVFVYIATDLYIALCVTFVKAATRQSSKVGKKNYSERQPAQATKPPDWGMASRRRKGSTWYWKAI